MIGLYFNDANLLTENREEEQQRHADVCRSGGSN